MQVAIDAVKNQGAREVIVAVPVGPPDTLRILERSANQVICLLSPPDFISVGDYYSDFTQTSDVEVQQLLADAGRLKEFRIAEGP
jgi:predicted phosphoribosyltransferase